MTRSEKDRLLIERVKAGDNLAFKELIEKYKNDAFTLACSIVKNQRLAEDILQEVFIHIFDKIKTFKYKSSFYTWLYRIVVNRCYNELRKRKYKCEEIVEIASEKDEAASIANTNDLKQIIRTALVQMKPDEALVLRLFYLSELNIQEVMEVTGFGKPKVKVTLHRGRKSLADILKKQLGKEIEDI
ncbi:MAG: RNA polymerase sigma factor [Bacteroidetes bacterium]|nr:RNA polymerase sigma factor [Bacteroidota bacterium]MCB0853516.1 RNA polymerase sigma factor [Bacteroidota bacterium]